MICSSPHLYLGTRIGGPAHPASGDLLRRREDKVVRARAEHDHEESSDREARVPNGAQSSRLQAQRHPASYFWYVLLQTELFSWPTSRQCE